MLRQSLAGLALALACTLPPPAAAQQRIVAPDGWTPSVNAATGTIYFRCEAKACVPGSLVSAKRQPDGAQDSLTAFRANVEQRGAAVLQASGGAYRAFRIVTVYAKEVAPIRAQIAVWVISRADGGEEPTALALVSNGQTRFTLVSTGKDAATVRKNVETMLPIPFILTTLNDDAKARR
ncbi:hypothetical protein GCM10008171_09970 [Methylopila jiangsuensis]|uniref:Uncharacterized protein n=1 Tax=Methylopila jiangsuensis TaxID=586230 RepID=A0A9W6JHQ7_9HYPH|nr:hypothetical protein [Methylopila jiangsuensis]MDR6285986.1 hypothetical protein [Methylopila jiangsuensis]GLK75743.1 hypothetical protein GCM10008171_09970 [Methylopila jiangsuensis]